MEVKLDKRQVELIHGILREKLKRVIGSAEEYDLLLHLNAKLLADEKGECDADRRQEVCGAGGGEGEVG
jgi:hypothetical protein